MDKTRSDYIAIAEEYLDKIHNLTDGLYYNDCVDYGEFQIDGIETIDSGASKVVLILDNDPYVIKIPLIGEEYRDDDSDEGEECGYSYYEGAPLDNGENYCQAEADIYELIVPKKFKKLFLPTTYIGTTKHEIPIYIQPRAHVFSNVDQKKYSSKPLEKRFSKRREKLSSTFASAIGNAYGEDYVEEFLQFLNDTDLFDDCHSDSNVAIWKEKPVLLDYCSFWG